MLRYRVKTLKELLNSGWSMSDTQDRLYLNNLDKPHTSVVESIDTEQLNMLKGEIGIYAGIVLGIESVGFEPNRIVYVPKEACVLLDEPSSLRTTKVADVSYHIQGV